MTTPDQTRAARPTRLALVALFALAALGTASCASEAESGAADSPSAGVESASAAKSQAATVIDVRTPDEFDSGHVEGAELIDIKDAGFSDRIASLDAATTYVVYCRSGNRSAAARAQMEAAGLTVLDGGSLQDMAKGGWATT